MIRKCGGKIHLCYVIMDIIRISSISLLFYNVIYIYIYTNMNMFREMELFLYVSYYLKKNTVQLFFFFTVNSADNTGHGQD